MTPRGHQTMHSLAWQAASSVIACVLAATSAIAAPRGKYATQLAEECDALIAIAVVRPYGWGWEAKLDSSEANARQPAVSMEPGGTPAAGLLLLWAGEVLREPRYTEAAVNAARGVAASQQSTGKVLAHPAFGASPGGREAPSATPERGATRASLALLLAVVGADESRDAQFTAAARRAATWLAKQQSKDGGWPSAYPPDASPLDALRLIRLDSSDYRDSTLALLLACDALDDKLSGRAAAKSIAKLLSLRLHGPGRLSNAWSSAYLLNGAFVEQRPEFPPAADMVATRYALQTLLGASIMTRDAEARATLDAAAITLANLRDERGNWRRLYALDPLRGTASATTEPSLVATTQPLIDVDASGTFGLDALLDAVRLLQTLSPDEYEARLREQTAPREQIALTICGLIDEPMTLDWPGGVDDAKEYLARHAERWRIIDGPRPTELAAQTARLHALLVRARLEALFPDVDVEHQAEVRNP